MIAIDAGLIIFVILMCAFNLGVMLASSGWQRWIALALIAVAGIANVTHNTPLLIAVIMAVFLPLVYRGFLHQAEEVVNESDKDHSTTAPI